MLTDLMMPGLDGSRLIDEVKNLSPQTPAILLSGKVQIYDRDTRADVFLAQGNVRTGRTAGAHPPAAGAQARPQARQPVNQAATSAPPKYRPRLPDSEPA